jgi:hypothetical protein
MEQFEKNRIADLEKYFAQFGEAIAKGWISPEAIFAHAYNLGALGWENRNKEKTNGH